MIKNNSGSRVVIWDIYEQRIMVYNLIVVENYIDYLDCGDNLSDVFIYGVTSFAPEFID